VTAALEAVHADRVATDALGLQRMAHRRALVDHLDTVLLQHRHERLGTAASRLDDAHATLDDGPDVLGIRRRHEHRQERDVHADRLVRQVACSLDLGRELLGRRLRERSDHAEAARVRHGGRQFGKPDEMHATLDDRVLDAKEVGDAGLHGGRVLLRAVTSALGT
jgi:hypothetical protein